MPRGQKEDSGLPTAPGWMVTYGDIMTLLLTFFVLLLSFSSIQEAKFKEAIGALQSALGVLENPKMSLQSKDIPVQTQLPLQMRETNIQMERVIDVLKEAGLEGSFDVFPTKEGFAVRLSSPLLFDLGSADLREDVKGILSRLAGILASFDNTLRIEGHTDNIPIHTPKFPSNWELSAARALSVLRFLNSHDIASERLSAVGYGEFRPLLENDTQENRDKNRRVEIHVRLSVREKPAFKRIFMNGGFDG